MKIYINEEIIHNYNYNDNLINVSFYGYTELKLFKCGYDCIIPRVPFKKLFYDNLIDKNSKKTNVFLNIGSNDSLQQKYLKYKKKYLHLKYKKKDFNFLNK